MKARAKKIFLVVGGICSTIAVCVVFGFFGKNEEDVIINRIVGIVAIISGLGSLLVGISSIFSTSLDNVREYYATGDTKEMSDSRYVLYNYRYIKLKYGKTIFDEDFDEWAKSDVVLNDKGLKPTSTNEILDAAGIQINFFQMWGLLQSKGFLPIWVFETASGYSIFKLYEAVNEIIADRMKTNPFYAGQFRDLCKRIEAKNKKAFIECRKTEEEYIGKELEIKNPFESENFNNFLKIK